MKIVAVTSCPSGVAHTYMAAEALKKAAAAKGHDIKVETQGSIGIENEISAEDVKNADVVILTKDVALINVERFDGKPTVKVAISDVVKKSEKILTQIEDALAKKN